MFGSQQSSCVHSVLLNLLLQVKKFLTVLPDLALSCFVRGLRKSHNPVNNRLADILEETAAQLSQTEDAL